MSVASKWDYCYVRVVNEQKWVSESLWEQGKQGWELVSAQLETDGKYRTMHLFFKRPL